MKGRMKDIDAHLAAVFAPHEVPAAFRTTEAFSFVDDKRIYPFDDCNLPELGGNELELWAGDPTKAASMARQLLIWLHGSSGCLYGFWSHDGRPMLESPIVYLDDEGCGNGVVADNLDEFLAIAANGFRRITPAGCEPDLDELQDQETEAFFTARGIEPAMDYGARIQAASRAHPDFDAWLSSELDAPR